jgi:hypothetical protein
MTRAGRIPQTSRHRDGGEGERDDGQAENPSAVEVRRALHDRPGPRPQRGRYLFDDDVPPDEPVRQHGRKDECERRAGRGRREWTRHPPREPQCERREPQGHDVEEVSVVQLRVAVRRAREPGRDEQHDPVDDEECGDEGALALRAASRGAQEVGDDDRRDDERDDEHVQLPRRQVVHGEARHGDDVVLAPEVRVAAERAVRGRRGQEEAHGEAGDADGHGQQRRPQAENRVAERKASWLEGPDQERPPEKRDHQRRKLRTRRVREDDGPEHRELALDRRALEREDDREERDAGREVRHALRQHQRGVDRRGNRQRRRGHAHAPPLRDEPPREEVDRNGGQREEQRVEQFHVRVGGDDGRRQRQDGREHDRVHGAVAVRLSPQVQPLTVREAARGDRVPELVGIDERHLDELGGRPVADDGHRDERREGEERPTPGASGGKRARAVRPPIDTRACRLTGHDPHGHASHGTHRVPAGVAR